MTRQKKTGAYEEWKHREDAAGRGEDASGRELWEGGMKQVALEWGLEREISIKNGNRRAERKEVG